MAEIISVTNQKGGVGKTTTVINLGAALAELGKRTLLVDFDPSPSLSIAFGIEQPVCSVAEAMMRPDEAGSRCVVESGVHDLWLAPGSEDLAGVEVALGQELNRERYLQRLLRRWRDQFDFILIDNTPGLGLLTVNALTAADSVLIPVECQYLAIKGLALLLKTLERMRTSELNPTLAIRGVLPTLYDSRVAQARQAVEKLRERFGEKVFRTVIRVRSQFSYATVAHKPVTLLDPTGEAAEMYRDVAREMLGLPPCTQASMKASA